MTATKVRFGLDNLLHENRMNLRDVSNAAGFTSRNLADWRAGIYWKNAMDANPPSDAYVYVYPLNLIDATSKGARIDVVNWYMRDWTAGAAAAPDGWALVGAAASVARDAAPTKIDLYSAELTRAGTNCYLEQELDSPDDYIGRELTAGAWVYATVADRARITILTDAGSTSSAYHAGTSAWVWLEVTHEVEHDATEISIRLEVNGGDTAANFDGVACYIGDEIDSTPHAAAVDYLALHDHNCHTMGVAVTLESSDDPGDWSTPTTRITMAFTSDKSAWKDIATAITKSAWRLKVTSATGSGQTAIGVASFGKFLEFPDWILPGFDPYKRVLRSALETTRNGTPIGRQIQRTPIPMTLTLPFPTKTYMTGDFLTLWNHLGESGSRCWRGLPGFLAWDSGGNGDSIFLVWSPEGAQVGSGGLMWSSQGREMRLDLLAASE